MQYALISKLDVYSPLHPQDGNDYFFVQELWPDPPVLTPELQIEQCDDTVEFGWLYNPTDGTFAPASGQLDMRRKA